jgi:hypothetical protein
MTVESDWVPLTFFSLVALSETALSSYKETSLQGDSAFVKIYKWELKLILKEMKWLWLKNSWF